MPHRNRRPATHVTETPSATRAERSITAIRAEIEGLRAGLAAGRIDQNDGLAHLLDLRREIMPHLFVHNDLVDRRARISIEAADAEAQWERTKGLCRWAFRNSQGCVCFPCWCLRSRPTLARTA